MGQKPPKIIDAEFRVVGEQRSQWSEWTWLQRVVYLVVLLGGIGAIKLAAAWGFATFTGH